MIRDSFDDIYYPENVIELINRNTDEKMVDHIRTANRDHMEDVGMTYMGIKISYRELFAHINEHARALKQFGLVKGDYITICLPNSPEAIYYFYACNDIGVTPYLIDPRFTLGKMKICISDSCSKLFVCEMGTFCAKVAPYIDDIRENGAFPPIVVVSPLSTLDKQKYLSIKQFILKHLYRAKTASQRRRIEKKGKLFSQEAFISAGAHYSGRVSTEYDPAIPAIVVNTSGTSGESVKGAMHSNKSYNIIANQTSFITDEVRRGYTYYGYIPFFSMYGSGVGMQTALSYGIAIDLIPKFDGKKSIQQFLDKRENVLIGVPMLFDSMAKICVEKNQDMSFAKIFVMGGDNVTPEMLENINQSFSSLGMKKKVIYGYGCTEAGMMITTSDDERSHIYGSSGIPHTGVRIKIINPDTYETLGYGEEGEVCIHTETLMMGYLNKPDENKVVFIEIDGIRFFRTGDKGYIVDTGHLFLTGRYKRLMKRPDGHQVSPIPIENAVGSHPLVSDCCVVGLKKSSDVSGVIPTAFIKATKDTLSDAEIKEIAEMALQQLSGEREAALSYIVVDAIPYTNNGKMDYRKLECTDLHACRFYVIDDAITREYFKDFPNALFIKINKTKMASNSNT